MNKFYHHEIQKLIKGVKTLEDQFYTVAKDMDKFCETRAFEIEKVAMKLYRLIEELEVIV